MTIEQRLAHDLGTTRDPHLAVWLLRDGTLVNGSVEGHQRDVDHHEIGSYFNRSNRETPGSSAIYVAKFERRGNVRWGCSPYGYWAELSGPPSQQTLDVLARHFLRASRAGIETCVVRRTRRGTGAQTDIHGFLRYAARYTNLDVPDVDAPLDDT